MLYMPVLGLQLGDCSSGVAWQWALNLQNKKGKCLQTKWNPDVQRNKKLSLCAKTWQSELFSSLIYIVPWEEYQIIILPKVENYCKNKENSIFNLKTTSDTNNLRLESWVGAHLIEFDIFSWLYWWLRAWCSTLWSQQDAALWLYLALSCVP